MSKFVPPPGPPSPVNVTHGSIGNGSRSADQTEDEEGGRAPALVTAIMPQPPTSRSASDLLLLLAPFMNVKILVLGAMNHRDFSTMKPQNNVTFNDLLPFYIENH